MDPKLKILVAAENSELSKRVAATFTDRSDVVLVSVKGMSEIIGAAGAMDQSDRPVSLVVLDYELPGLGGLKGVRQIASHLNRVPVALILRGGSLEFAQRAYSAGANSIIADDLSAKDMSMALCLAERGLYVTLLSDVMHTEVNPAFPQLSERELQVLRGLCDGLQNKEIAHAFSIQEVTVKMHMRAVVRKLGAKNRTHAAMIARDQNLI